LQCWKKIQREGSNTSRSWNWPPPATSHLTDAFVHNSTSTQKN
jgi:hypothetical protein